MINLILFYEQINLNNFQAYVIDITLEKPILLEKGICSSVNFVKSDYGFSPHPINDNKFIYDRKISEYDNKFGKDNWKIEYFGDFCSITDIRLLNAINIALDRKVLEIPNNDIKNVSVIEKHKYWFITYRNDDVHGNKFYQNKILDNIHPFVFIANQDKNQIWLLWQYREITEEEFILNIQCLNNKELIGIPIFYLMKEDKIENNVITLNM